MITVLIPAHNEAEGIAATIHGLKNQTLTPDRIVVVADNCTDATVSIAESLGVEVFETVGNKHKKAGALNQALRSVMQNASPDDLILLMDADSVLIPEWIEYAIPNLTDQEGGISGAYVPRHMKGIVPALQSVEYAQERRRIARKGGLVDVLSGTAALFEVRTLNRVAAERGRLLPGNPGDFYVEDSLTEDFEITIALQRLGFIPRCPIECKVITDVMPNWRSLAIQRIRWQRGTVETLLSYGWNATTKRLWALQVWTYMRTFAWPLVIIMYIATALLIGSFALSPIFLLIIPVLITEQVVTAWKAGVRGRVVAAMLIPSAIYDNFRSYVYWVALARSVLGTEKTWVTN